MLQRFINGKRVADRAGAVECSDAAFVLGEGAFETMLVRDGFVMRLDHHDARLNRGCAQIGIPTLNWDSVFSCLDVFRHSSNARDVTLRVQVSRGPISGGFASDACDAPTVFVTIADAPPRPHSLRPTLVDWPRRAEGGLASEFKCLGYANELAARRKAIAAGADIALMLGSSGSVACADTANLFLVTGGQIITSAQSAGALRGTVREVMPNLAAEAGFVFVEGHISPEDLAKADGLFLTNSFLGACVVDPVIDRRLPRPLPRIAKLVDELRSTLLDVGRYGHAII